jgi:hypothetical protein
VPSRELATVLSGPYNRHVLPLAVVDGVEVSCFISSITAAPTAAIPDVTALLTYLKYLISGWPPAVGWSTLDLVHTIMFSG